jgi:hypothetical protein
MKNYLLILLFQIGFNIFKVLEIRYTYENKIPQLLTNSIWINLMALGSTYYSLDSLFRGDYFGVMFYISGSIIGKWIAMTQYDHFKNKIKYFFKKGGNDEREIL